MHTRQYLRHTLKDSTLVVREGEVAAPLAVERTSALPEEVGQEGEQDERELG